MAVDPKPGKRLRILVSAYSCGPNRGSEPGVGWGAAMALAAHADVHVLTTFEFRESIERVVAAGGVPENLHFHFFDLPGAGWWWKHGHLRGIQFHYALWQRFAGRVVRALHRQYHFDAAQHVTFVRYWNPSCLRNSGIPYVFGPVGGADTPPTELVRQYSWSRRLKEVFRRVYHWLGDHSPATLRTLRNASFVFAATQQTLDRCRALGVSKEKSGICQAIALSKSEFECLSSLQLPASLTFFTLGRLDPLKGYDLAVRAFAAADIPESRLLMIGGGPDESRIRSLAEQLGVSNCVEITGFLPRKAALEHMERGTVLLHPSHLDSGGLAVVEAMAAGRPVICLDVGGPGLSVRSNCGFKVKPVSNDFIVRSMAVAMRRFRDDRLTCSMGLAARARAQANFRWENRGSLYALMLSRLQDLRRPVIR